MHASLPSPPFSFSDLICLGDPSPNFLSLGSPYKYNFQKLHHLEYLQDNHGVPESAKTNKQLNLIWQLLVLH